jgi:hypothetical protein
MSAEDDDLSCCKSEGCTDKDRLELLYDMSSPETTFNVKEYHFRRESTNVIPIGMSNSHGVIMSQTSENRFELSVIDHGNIRGLSTPYEDYGKRTHLDPWKTYPEPFNEFICGSVCGDEVCLLEKYRYLRISIGGGNWVLKEQICIKKESGNSYKSAIACAHNQHIMACITDNNRLYYKRHASKRFSMMAFDVLDDRVPTTLNISENTEGDWCMFIIVGFEKGTIRIYRVGEVDQLNDSLEEIKVFNNRGSPYSLTIFKSNMLYTQNNDSLILFEGSEYVMERDFYLESIPYWVELIDGHAAVIHDRSDGLYVALSSEEIPDFVISNDIITKWSGNYNPQRAGYIYPSVRVNQSYIHLLLTNGCLVQISKQK